MFKIVETTERGSQKLTIVPCQWEKNGELSWPKFKADKFIKLGDSQPEDNWFRMPCKLKRNHLLNYDIAEEEMDRMLERNDTTDQEDNRPKRLLKRFKSKLNTNQCNDDFNAIANASCSVSHV